MWFQQLVFHQAMRASLLAAVSLLSLSVCTSATWAGPLDALRLYDQGITFYNKGDKPQALSLFEKATKEDPQFADAYYNMGTIYYQNKQYAKAESSFRKALQYAPQDTQTQYNLALTLGKVGKYWEAVNLLKKIPANDPKYPRVAERLAEWEPLSKPSAKTRDAARKDPAKEVYTSKAASNDKPAIKDDAIKPVSTFVSGFAGPTGMAFGGQGEMYVANFSKNLIYRVSHAGEKTVFAQGEGLKGPIGLVYNPRSGMLYAANYYQNNVVRITPEGKISILAAGLNKPYNLVLDPYNQTLYVSEQETNTVSKIDLLK